MSVKVNIDLPETASARFGEDYPTVNCIRFIKYITGCRLRNAKAVVDKARKETVTITMDDSAFCKMYFEMRHDSNGSDGDTFKNVYDIISFEMIEYIDDGSKDDFDLRSKNVND